MLSRYTRKPSVRSRVWRDSAASPENDRQEPSFFMSLSHKAALYSVGLVLTVLLILGLFSYMENRRQTLDSASAGAFSVARAVAVGIDGDAMARELESEEKTENWQAVKRDLEKVQENTRLSALYIVGLPEDGFHRLYVAAFHDRPVGYRRETALLPNALMRTLDTGLVLRSRVLTVANDDGDGTSGKFISAFAPVRDTAGTVVGAVAAVVDATAALAQADAFGGKLLLLTISLVLLSGLFVFWLSRRTVGVPLLALTDATRMLADGTPDIPAVPTDNNELGLLAENIRRVALAVNTLVRGVDKLSSRTFNDADDHARRALPGNYLKVAEGVHKAIAIMDNFDSTVYIVDPKTYQFLYFNRRMEHVNALTPDQLESVRCYQVIGDRGDAPCAMCPLPKLFNSRSNTQYPFHDFEYFNIHTRNWFSVRASLIRWFDGRLVLFCVARDIGEAKKAEEKQREQERLLEDAVRAANEANRLKSTFLATMSHELRTPMNGIIGFSELAVNDPDTPPNIRDYLGKIHESALELLELINNILDISRLESGDIEAADVPFTVRDIFDELNAAYRPRASEKGLELFFYAESFSIGTLRGDTDKLRQVLRILLDNAVKFTKEGLVKVVCSVTGTDDDGITLRFEVSDSGIGIAAEKLDHIWGAFAQAEAGATRQFGGAGLGLAIAKGFVEKMGGALGLVSTPGIGSKFSFSLRFAVEKKADEAEAAQPSTGDSVRLRRIAQERPVGAIPRFAGEVLVCEDNRLNQEVVLEHLSRVGVRAVFVSDGEQGVLMAQRRMEEGRPFDLIFMDVHMPRMGGIEAARRLKELGNTAPIIAFTANVMARDRENYTRFGMVDILNKPFMARELWDCLDRHLTRVEDLPPDADANAGRADAVPGDLPGGDILDHRTGLENAAGNARLHRRLLRNFYLDHRNHMEELSAALANNNRPLAYRLVHTLKSTSALIGAATLSRTAAQIERTLADGDGDVVDTTLRDLGSDLRVVLRVLEPLVAGGDTQAGKGEAVNESAVELLLARLRPLLASGNPECLAMKDELERELASAPHGRELLEHIDNYDFELALTAVDAIQAWLRDGSEGGAE
ncbi:MAG: ATP-binding protein [Planctomycetaceae bacterium]|nr:ATP-binding protein [Planctomycetaceae bacterium]